MNAMATAQFGDGVSTQRRSRPARPPAKQPQRTDDFAAVKNGLDSFRTRFYTSSGRLPNAKTDDTRRSRTLAGGTGDRHLSQFDLWVEREISRTMREQSPIFEGMIGTWAAEVIQSGWDVQPDTGSADLDAHVSEYLFGWDGDEGWSSICDARRMFHLWDLLTVAEETELTDGDHAFYLDPDGNDGLGSVQIIEGDRILSPYGAKIAPGWTLINGFFINPTGRSMWAWVANEAPLWGFGSVELGQAVKLYDPMRPQEGGLLFSCTPKRYTATRRAPYLSTAVRTHDEIDDVFVAVRVALRNAACRATYTMINDWDAYKEWMESVNAAYGSNYVGPAMADALEHSPNPGDHTIHNPGEMPGVYETNAPGDNFDPFMQLQLQTLGLPLGMCVEEAVRVFQKSFSASRMAVEGTRRRYERRQKTIKRSKLIPLLQFAIARAQAKGELPKNEKCGRLLVGYPGWPYIEPLKDAQASAVLVQNKLRSRRTSATEIGDNWQKERKYMAEEKDLEPVATGGSGPGRPLTGTQSGGQQ